MERIKLNLIPSGVAPIIHLSQYDDGRQFGIDLFEGESVYVLDGTETLTVNSRKPDGHVVVINVTNTGTSSLDVDTVEQLTAVHGVSYAKLKIEKGSVTIATLPFLIDVSRDPLENGDPSESFVDNLQTQIALAVADQYDSANVVFDANPTAGHGVGFAVTSEGVLNAIPDELNDFSDVIAPTPASGDALVWNGNDWVNGTPTLDIDDLDDVTITTPTDGEILVYNNGTWENQANPASTANFAPDYDDTATYNTNDKIIYQGLLYVCLEDSVTGAWDSTKWQNISVADYNAELLPIQSGSATNTKDYIDNKFAYSTTEKVIGKWIDNKTLYEKVVSIPSIVMDSSFHNTAHGIANIDKVVYVYGIMTNNSYEFIPIPNIRPAQTKDNLPVGIELNADMTNVRYMNNWIDNIIECYVIMRYTKTT